MTEKKVCVHMPPLEFVRVDGVSMRLDDHRKVQPLTAAQVASNRAYLLRTYGGEAK